MIARTAGWILIAAALAGVSPSPLPAPAHPVARFDRASALRAPAADLAQVALARAAGQFVEVTRPDFAGMAGPDAALRGLRFATAPRGAGFGGLCKATTAWIDAGSGEAPVTASTVYKVVGDLTSPSDDTWDDRYEARLERQCASAGRVIPDQDSNFGQSIFFTANGGTYEAWQDAMAVQLAVAAAHSGAPVACPSLPSLDLADDLPPDDPAVVEDRENRRGCADARATVSRLDLGRLLSIDHVPCRDAANDLVCVSAEVLRYASFNRQVLWTLEVRYRRRAREAGEVLAVAIKPGYAVYD